MTLSRIEATISVLLLVQVATFCVPDKLFNAFVLPEPVAWQPLQNTCASANVIAVTVGVAVAVGEAEGAGDAVDVDSSATLEIFKDRV